MAADLETSFDPCHAQSFEARTCPHRYLDAIKGKEEDNYFTPVLNRVFDPQMHKVIVDVGCGNGFFSAGLKRLNGGQTLIGIDGNPLALEQARSRGFDKTFRIADLDTQSLPMDSSSADLVICKDVLEHLVNPTQVASEIARILRPSGTFLFHVPNHFPLFARLKFLFKNDVDTFRYFPDTDSWNFPHIRFFKFHDVVRKMNELGLDFSQNLSDSFAYAPFMRIGGFDRYLARRSPDQFAIGLTLSFKKR
jgi:SAM-dependent methyltransferase